VLLLDYRRAPIIERYYNLVCRIQPLLLLQLHCCWPVLTARYALITDVVRRPSVVACTSKTKPDRHTETLLASWHIADSVATSRSSSRCPPPPGRGDRPFLWKYDLPVTSCLRNIDSPSSVSTANDWMALARRACQLFVAVSIFLLLLNKSMIGG